MDDFLAMALKRMNGGSVALESLSNRLQDDIEQQSLTCSASTRSGNTSGVRIRDLY